MGKHLFEHYQPFSYLPNNSYIETFSNKKNERCSFNSWNKKCDCSGNIPICQNIVKNKIGGETLTISDALANRRFDNPYI